MVSKFPSPFWRLIPQNLALIFGQFGAGKTFYVVQEAYKAYMRWDIVISNMWLAFPHVRWYVPSELPPIIREVQDYHDNIATPSYAPSSYLSAHSIQRTKNKPRKFFFLIDEAWLFFNNRSFRENFSDKTMLEFLVQPRKYDCTLAVIVQSLDMLDVNFVRLAQDVIEFRKYILWLFRLGEAFDIKYLASQDWWDPDTPIIRRKFYLHPFFTFRARTQFFGWLYYTKEILGNRAIRSPDHVITLDTYLLLDRNKNFHNWRWKMPKQQAFWLTPKEADADTKCAPYTDRR